MLPRTFLAIALFVGLLLGASAASGDTAPEGAPPRAVGVTLNPGPGGEAQAYRLFVAAGANGLEAPQPWSTLEPKRRRFHLGDVAAIAAGVRADPEAQVMLIPAAVETTSRSVPADLQDAPWGSARMIGRYRGLLRRIAPRLNRRVRYVSIANEADVYFTAHPAELPAFLRFARAEIAELHRLVPWARAGVTVTYTGLTSAHPRVARTLARLGDATALTYYPLAGGYRMRSPEAPLRDIPRMVRIASGRTLLIQEAGYSSAPRLGGSPAAQAEFVRNVFKAWNRFPAQIPFLSFYSLFDQPASTCRGHSLAVTFLCSLGLRRADGRPKPAWPAFRSGVRTIGTGRPTKATAPA